jgi:hypothetical protein
VSLEGTLVHQLLSHLARWSRSSQYVFLLIVEDCSGAKGSLGRAGTRARGRRVVRMARGKGLGGLGGTVSAAGRGTIRIADALRSKRTPYVQPDHASERVIADIGKQARERTRNTSMVVALFATSRRQTTMLVRSLTSCYPVRRGSLTYVLSRSEAQVIPPFPRFRRGNMYKPRRCCDYLSITMRVQIRQYFQNATSARPS